MAGPITLSGLASGIDTASIISKLVSASSGNLENMQSRAADLRGAVTTLSGIGRALSALKSAATSLSSTQGSLGFAASSSDSAVTATATGEAQRGSYEVTVDHLATEQKTYSAQFASASTALGQTGSLRIDVGGTGADIDVRSDDSLQGIATKINGAGLRASASVFFDGSQYRLQVRGLDTGASNAITFAEHEIELGLNGQGETESSGRTVQEAVNALATVDGFAISSASNQITTAIPGVTLTLAEKTSSPVKVTVDTDSKTLAERIGAVVSAYNSVVQGAHTASGYGEAKASNSVLAGDSAVRQVTDRLSSTVLRSYGSGSYTTLAAIGVSMNKDGTLGLDQNKLNKALASDASSVQKVLGPAPGSITGGAMTALSSLADKLSGAATGTISLRQNAFSSEATRLDRRVADEQDRLDRYAENLRKQFAAMETSYAASQQLIAQLAKLDTSSST